MAFGNPIQPKAYTMSIAGGTGFGGSNLITFSGTAVCAIIWNLSNADLWVRLNNDPSCVFRVFAETNFALNNGDAQFTSIDFSNSTSGAPAINIQVFVGVFTG